MDNPQIAIEILLAIAVVSLQLFFFFSTKGRIKKLSQLFPKAKLDESYIQFSDTTEGSIELIKIDEKNFSRDFTEVINSINKYLRRNRGATDFSIIQSIVERAIEIKENWVSANVSLPLYIGLMGTFAGVIVGLVKIAFFGGVTEQNINSFIGGVVIAMGASFFGLFLTVINNSGNFRDAKAECDQKKTSFFNFLQVDLLPHLGNSLYDALDRLKYNINDFNKKFETNIQLFDSKFSGNISSLSTSVQSLSENIGAVVENTKTQKEFLFELKKIGYNRMAEANIKVFQLLKDTGPTFIKFIEKQKELTLAVEHAAGFVNTIDSILNRIKTFEESINHLGETINTRQYLGNEVLKRIDVNLSYLDKQFELLKQHEIKSSENIEDFFKRQYAKIQELADNIKREVETSLDVNIENNPFQKLNLLENIDKSMTEMNGKVNSNNDLSHLTETLGNSMNEIKTKMDFTDDLLRLLETIEKNMGEIKSKVNLNGDFKKIMEEVSLTKSEIQELKQKVVKAIEDNKQKSIPVQTPTYSGNGNQQNEEVKLKLPRRVGILTRFRNIFKWSRGGKT